MYNFFIKIQIFQMFCIKICFSEAEPIGAEIF